VHCEDGSLSCSWAKLSAVVKNAFASSPSKAKLPSAAQQPVSP
jgi:hypothetical protein